MALPIYPAGLPFVPLRDAYDVPRRHLPLVVSDMESGPTRQRAISNAIWSQHSYQIVMTLSEFDSFDTFVITTLGQGAGHFMMPVGRIQKPLPWPSKRVYIEGGDYAPKPYGDGTVLVVFKLNVLDW